MRKENANDRNYISEFEIIILTAIYALLSLILLALLNTEPVKHNKDSILGIFKEDDSDTVKLQLESKNVVRPYSFDVFDFTIKKHSLGIINSIEPKNKVGEYKHKAFFKDECEYSYTEFSLNNLKNYIVFDDFNKIVILEKNCFNGIVKVVAKKLKDN